MPWYWILVVISVIVGPFEALHAVNRARERRDKARRQQNSRPGQ